MLSSISNDVRSYNNFKKEIMSYSSGSIKGCKLSSLENPLRMLKTMEPLFTISTIMSKNILISFQRKKMFYPKENTTFISYTFKSFVFI
jgi:hypothetical protein